MKFLKFLMLPIVALALVLGCAQSGTVAADPVVKATNMERSRVEAYVTLRADALSADEMGQYNAAKFTLDNLPKDKRVAAAQSWLAVDTICKLHDKLVNADANLDEVHKKVYLMTSDLLRREYQAAFQASGQDPPKPESQPVPFPKPAEPFQCPDGSCNLGQR